MTDFDMICCVVHDGQGSRALKLAKRHGVRGGTICLGMGTVHTWLLDLLDLTEIRKEIVFMAVERALARETMAALSHDMSFHKPHHGIIFSMPLSGFLGAKRRDLGLQETREEGEAVEQMKYRAIFVVVDRGLAEDAVAAAKGAGARGGTIIAARGSGIHDTDTVFSMPIEPEREVAMILAQADKVPAINDALREHLRLDEPGNGVLFVLDVDEAMGLY